ncbi:MAG: methyltransferase domain-containing protein [Candidatus Omnitrophota bacterium]
MSTSTRDPKLMALTKCPLCHGARRKRLFVLDQYDVYECSGCRLRYIDPCLSPEGTRYYYSSEETLMELNAFHSSYYDFGDPNANSKTVRDFTRTLKALEKDLRDGDRKIFDVGCGNGLFLAVAKKRGWKVSGCEPSESNVVLAKSKFGVDIHCADFDVFVPTDEKYDVISFWDVLEHLVEPSAFIDKARGMLKSGGRIVVGGPNDRSFLRILASWIYALTGGRVRGPLQKAYLLEHVTYYTNATMSRLFEKHGFVPESSLVSSTDSAKYHLTLPEALMANSVLTVGKCLGLQNRMIAVFRACV